MDDSVLRKRVAARHGGDDCAFISREFMDVRAGVEG